MVLSETPAKWILCIANNSLLLGYVEDCPKRSQMDGYCGLRLALFA